MCNHAAPTSISLSLTGTLGVPRPCCFYLPMLTRGWPHSLRRVYLVDRMSKTALNQFTKCLSIESKRDNCFPVRQESGSQR